MSDSIWSDGGRIQMPQYEKLTRIKKVDVTIVGGGLCGLLCAYFLKEAGVECLLLEGSRIAVSYTHLDVYKRQATDSPAEPIV